MSTVSGKKTNRLCLCDRIAECQRTSIKVLGKLWLFRQSTLFNSRFLGQLRQADTILDIIIAEDDRGGVITAAISHAKLESNHHHQQT